MSNNLPAITKMKQYFLFLCLLLRFQREATTAASPDKEKGYRIAIIGGGIGGTFTAKYLSEYDVNHRNDKRSHCSLDEIVVFDVSPPPVDTPNNEVVTSSSDPRPKHWQGSRVSSLTLRDGSVIELGASIIYSGNQLVVDMMQDDPEYLVKGKPMGLGKKTTDGERKDVNPKKDENKQPTGFGIYHGNREWLLKPRLFSSYPSILRSILQPLYFLWRYNFDYFRLQRAVKQAIHAFDIVYALLNDTDKEVTYFTNPMEMWNAIGLKPLAGISFHDFLDELGLSRDESLELSDSNSGNRNYWWNWRSWLPGMGCLRSELVTAMTINTYNQDLSEMNGE
jgi:prenylcysteine oxidase/farnesylcysteine lyase